MEQDNTQFEKKVKKAPLRDASPRLFKRVAKELDKGKSVFEKAAEKNIWPKLFAEASVALMVVAIGLSLWTYMHNRQSDDVSIPGLEHAEQPPKVIQVNKTDVQTSLPANGVLRVERVWEQCNDRGTFMIDAETPVRTYERTFIREIEWRNPQTNGTLQMKIPKRDVILVTVPVY